MGRTPAVAGGRPIVVPVRLSESEMRALDERRGSLSRSQYMRLLINRATRQAPKP